jgi:hypothetical protein
MDKLSELNKSKAFIGQPNNRQLLKEICNTTLTMQTISNFCGAANQETSESSKKFGFHITFHITS